MKKKSKQIRILTQKSPRVFCWYELPEIRVYSDRQLFWSPDLILIWMKFSGQRVEFVAQNTIL